MENTLLNLIPAAYLPEIHLSQYDVGRTITFTLKDGASDYSVPSGASVKVKATKPSGFGFEVACTFNGGTVTLVTTDTMTPENGRFPAELSIVSGNTTIGTSNFIFNIERSPHPEGTTDGDAETIIPELTLLVERIEAAAEDVDEKAELFLNLSAEAETLEAGSPATASYSDGVLTLGIPRGYDGDDTKADAIVKSASGEVASFSDGGNGLLVKTLNVNITPIQSGSGDPSPINERPISGTDTVNIFDTGINIWDEQTELGILNTDGSVAPNTQRLTTKNYIPIKEGIEYCMSAPSVTTRGRGAYYDENFNLVEYMSDFPASVTISGSRQYGMFTPPSGARYLKVCLTVNYGTTYNNDISFNYPSTDTSYHSGKDNTSYPISLGQTVYGGTLEVMSGKLIPYGRIDLGSLNYGKTTSYARPVFYKELAGAKIGVENVKPNAYCEIFDIGRSDSAQGLASQGNNLITIAKGTNQLLISYETDMSASDFKAFVTGKYFVYPLATPTEITLTPTQVKTLLGNNNIWSDSGTVEVEYRADTTLAYNELLSLIASLS